MASPVRPRGSSTQTMRKVPGCWRYGGTSQQDAKDRRLLCCCVALRSHRFLRLRWRRLGFAMALPVRFVRHPFIAGLSWRLKSPGSGTGYGPELQPSEFSGGSVRCTWQRPDRGAGVARKRPVQYDRESATRRDERAVPAHDSESARGTFWIEGAQGAERSGRLGSGGGEERRRATQFVRFGCRGRGLARGFRCSG